jgi:DNA repair protein RecO (recombination protein O)
MIRAETNGPGYDLSGTRLISCFYMNELLVRMLHRHESHPELFRIYESSMILLNEGNAEDRVLRVFEKNLLQSLGYGLILDHDVDTGDKIDTKADYFYQIGYGPVRKMPVNLRNMPVSGRTLVALHSENDWGDEISRQAKALLRVILTDYTGDKPIASRDLYKAYLQHSSPA